MAGDPVAVVNLLNGISKYLRDMVKGDREQQEDYERALEGAKCELRLLRTWMNKEISGSNEGHGEPQKWILKLQELVYDMEDFMADRSRDRKTSAPTRLLKAAAFQGDPRPDHVKCVEGFMEKIKEITNAERPSPAAAAAAPLGGTTAGGSCRLGSAPPYDDPVGMEQPKEEMIQLLQADGGHEDERKVVSIVGCAGVGKTTLAKALWYDPRVQNRFPHTHRVWVPAPQSPDKVHSVLESLLQDFRPHGNQKKRNKQHCHRAQEAADAAGDGGLHKLQRALQEFFGNKRYLVIVDGVQQREVLDTILSALPENKNGSRVVVTTSICSVAKGISSGGYLYTMRGLGSAETAKLFLRTLNLEDPSPGVQDGLKTICDKCDGLPLVVVGASKFLRRHGAALSREHCKKVGTALGNHLAGRDLSFEEARTALARYWHSLDRYEQNMCMFSLSSFPKDDDGGIKTKSLLRRWVAEGLVAQDDGKSADEVACEYRDKLLDLCVLEPVSVSMMGRNNRCQVHGVTLEYLVHRSVSWNFIALVQEGRLLPRGGAASSCSIRRVAIHGGDDEGDINRAVNDDDLPSVRSLTVRKTSTVPARLLEKCRMLRVLDLEGCAWVGIGSESDDHVRLICELLHLRYLSLRSTRVAEIPRAIKHLHSLETLDLRDTKVDKLPMEVLMLPQLAHLFGRFELPAQLEADPKRKLEYFFSNKSKLVTLAGFKIIVNSKRRGHELILRHARTLKKVKVWCELPPDDDPAATIRPPKGVFSKLRFRRMCRDVPRPRNYKKVDAVSSPPDGTPSILDGLVTSLLHESRVIGSNALDSLSVDFLGSHYSHFLDCVLKDPCAVRSIKVRGRMERLPDSQVLMKLREIKELHLCNTGLGTNKLSELQSMHYLVSLKLKEDTEGFGDGSFVVEAGGFPSLQHLCFHSQRLPALTFTPGSMKSLLSLQLICLGPAGSDLGVTGVANLPCLDEVILHPDASDHKINAWREESHKHTHRPNVKRQQRSNHASNK